MRAPMAVGVRKSNGVPATGADLPGGDQRRVDRRVAVGVDRAMSLSPSTLPTLPARLK